MTKPGDLLDRVRRKRPFIDHLVRTFQRYQADGGDRLASGVTFYWFLSLFPILLIAVFFTRVALGADAGRQITDGLGPYLGDPTAKAVAKVVQDSAGKAGVIGLLGTLLSGLGWIEALREAIRTIWHQNIKAGNIVTRKIADVIALVGLFAVIVASVVVSGAATAATDNVLSFLGLSETSGAKAFTWASSYLLGAVIDVGIFLYLFVRLAKVRTPLRRVLKGALFGAVGFEVLKFVGAFYIGRTTSKGEATYGSFAVVVGLLLFLNLVSRLVLYTAAFTVTAPYDDDVPPSGTADPEQARKAGIPEQFAGSDLNLTEDGAPTPLGSALREDPRVERSWSSKQPEAVVEQPAPAVPAGGQTAGEKQVVLAARALTGASLAVVLGVGLYGAKTVTRLLRR
ncbi:MAG: rane protein [Frankiales bacterium]|nr:rane protein [Frankiales bacterium]